MSEEIKFTPLDLQTWERGQMFYYFSRRTCGLLQEL